MGYSGSGKDLVSDFLTTRGFVSIRLSDAIRNYADKNNIVLENTDSLVNLGNWLRSEYGADILPRLISTTDKFINAEKVVLNGIRNPSEVNYLHANHEAKIFALDIPEEKLLENLMNRKREGDPKTKDGFLKMLQREKGKDGESGMDIPGCIALSDVKIRNYGTKFDLEFETARSLSDLGIGRGRLARGHEHMV